MVRFDKARRFESSQKVTTSYFKKVKAMYILDFERGKFCKRVELAWGWFVTIGATPSSLL